METKEELQTSQDAPTVDETTAKDVESTSLPGPVTNDTKAESNEDDEPHYFPEVPESLDEAPER